MGEPYEGPNRKLRPWNYVRALVPWFLKRESRRNHALVGLALLGLVVLAFLGSIEQVLRDLHQPGEAPAGTEALAGGLSAWSPSEPEVRAVLTSWSDAAGVLGAQLEWILFAYGLADLALVGVYVLFAGILLVLLERQLGPGSGDELEDLSPYRRPVAIAIGALGLLAIVDVIENVGLIVSGFTGDGWLAWVLWAAFRLKVLLLLLVVVPGLVAVATFLAKRPTRRKGLWPALAVARGQWIVLAVLWAGFFVSDQSVDAVRRWSEDFVDAFFAIVTLAWLAAFMLVSTSSLLATAARRRAGSASEGSFLAAGLIVLVATGVSLVVFEAWVGLLALALVLLGVGVLSWLTESVPSTGDGRPVRGAQNWLPMMLGVLVLLLPILALVNAATGPVLLGQARYLWLYAFAVVLVGVAVLLARWSAGLHRHWERPVSRRGLYLFTAFIVAVVWIALVEDPWATSTTVGPVGFLGFFLLALALLLYALVRRAEETRPPDIVAIVRLRCTPVILLALVWAVAASLLDRESTYHDVRTITDTPVARATQPGVSPAKAFERWRGSELAGTEVRPILFVAAAGGGIRAAYWTATVLRCVLDGEAPSPNNDAAADCAHGGTPANERGAISLFAGSGASGGSLGLASYATHLTNPRITGWPGKQLGADYASIIVGWGLFVDVPSTLLRREGGSDRAEMLERFLERSWLDDEALEDESNSDDSLFARGLLELWGRKTAPKMPLLLLNATKVQQGCRLNVSVLDTSVEPVRKSREDDDGLEDVVDNCVSLRLFEENVGRENWSLASSDDLLTYLCPSEDLRLSTAVMLSARFPYALPSGNLRRAEIGKQECSHPDDAIANVVDGGYFDTSGASPVVELWNAVAPSVAEANEPRACIVPYFLQIDTGYSDPVKRDEGSPSELLVPPVAAIRARDAREHNARQAAALLFTGRPATGPEIQDRYAHIYPRAHAGVRAPLGWTLSDVAREELEEQLEHEENLKQIREVRGWLADPPSCSGVG